jgi:hypothetical protein
MCRPRKARLTLRLVTDKDFGRWWVAGFVVDSVSMLPILSQEEDFALLFRWCLFDADKGGLNGYFFIWLHKIFLQQNKGQHEITIISFKLFNLHPPLKSHPKTRLRGLCL